MKCTRLRMDPPEDRTERRAAGNHVVGDFPAWIARNMSTLLQPEKVKSLCWGRTLDERTVVLNPCLFRLSVSLLNGALGLLSGLS